MNISIATNFDNKLIDLVKQYGVTNLFGKLKNDFIGGGLEREHLDDIDRLKVENHVKYAHKNNMTVNYTLNSPCLGNDEFTYEGKQHIKELLDWLTEIKIDSVTVSIPALLRYIKKEYPNLEVKISSSVCVDSVAKAKRWVEFGADCIVLDPMVVNRNFKILKAIRDAVDIELELIVNNNCMYECPLLTYHQSYMGHSSRETDNKEIKYDFCYLNCSKKRVENPVNYLISDIIRPEDIGIYEALGYNQIKIIDRGTPIELMVIRAKAYFERRYDGNLLDLIQHFGYRDVSFPDEYLKNIYIDNKKLDNFMKKFEKGYCYLIGCGETCRHCHDYASEAINIDKSFQLKHLEAVNQALLEIENLAL
ncbi:U32 family peptidase [Paramaledivibacter caminithermalis]|uniref:Peptidase family U32 n=1 Tax=Paramaledivibacter caminithermalis (strain DSM 15212 / CIP 107654 / DViRD3) TaxID=1121301 RepID=A0A1M6TXT0_PARC5|nr:U32 family peptidase [Paramaledivibacter caminithermalis]SHK61700.1 Peptidase family U32 [Paramaledivibacter caminithermalis DSM 15212]